VGSLLCHNCHTVQGLEQSGYTDHTDINWIKQYTPTDVEVEDIADRTEWYQGGHEVLMHSFAINEQN